MGRRNTLGKDKVSIRVLLAREDYAELDKIAALERTDIGTLVRRAIARFFLVPALPGGNGPSGRGSQTGSPGGQR